MTTKMQPIGRSRALWLMLAHALLVQVISYGLRPTISYEILALGLDSAWLGLATASFALPPLLLALPAGRMVDRLGERGILIAGGITLTLAAAAALLYGTSGIGLIAATALLGLGVLFSVVGEQTWVMRAAPDDRLDFSFGLYTFATSTGQMLGPLLLLFPSPGAGAPPLGVVAGVTIVLGIVALVLSIGIPSALPATRQLGSKTTRPTGILGLIRQRGVPSALIASSIVLTSLDIVIAYLPLLAEERGISHAWVSVMLVARGAATMLSRLCLSLLTRRLGRRAVLICGGAVAAGSLALLALPFPAVALTVLLATYGLAAGTVQPLTMSWITLITAPTQRGMAASLRLVGNRVGQTFLPLAVAAVSTAGGATAVFAVMGGALLASSIVSRSAPNDGDDVGPAAAATPGN